MTLIDQDTTRQLVKDEEMLPRLMRDLLKVDNVTRRRGHRDTPEVDAGRQLLAEIQGQDLTVLPFHEAFRILAGGKGLTNLARRTGLSRSNLSRLLNGTAGRAPKAPKMDEMQAIADAFGKRPVYFAEYRSELIGQLVTQRLAADPDRSAVLTHQLGLGR